MTDPLTATKANAQNLLGQYEVVRGLTEGLCSPLLPEDTVIQPMPDVSPPKWHLAHSTWFFETFLLQRFLPGYVPFHPRYNFLFNSYYESIDHGNRLARPNRGSLTRPPLADIYAYRAFVDEAMLKLMNGVKDTDRSVFEALLTLGLQHEQQHQELLVTDIKYILCTNPLYPAYQPRVNPVSVHSSAPQKEWIGFAGGLYETGMESDGNHFAFDNEGPVHQVYLNDFKLSSQLVTNAEYLTFMEAGGYRDARLWLADGWQARTTQAWESPLYWLKDENGGWLEMTLGGLQPLALDAPVTHISYYEAEAYANFMQQRLPTEAEWEVAARVTAPDAGEGNFLENGLLHPVAPGKSEPGKLNQLLGNCWEHTVSAYLPYPGYRRPPDALGEYNGKFMVNQMVLRGGSCATPRSHIRLSYRNFFHPDKRWQFTGIRLAALA